MIVRRRDFIALLGAASAWPLAARAQQASVPVIGFLNSASPTEYARLIAAFRQGLNEAGYVEGQNIAIEYRWAEGRYDRLPAMASDLVRRDVKLIVGSTLAALAAKLETTTIPIVFLTPGDPVELGLVASLGRPGGNVTGVTTLNLEIGPKRLELLHEVVPTATTIALLVNPSNRNSETLIKNLRPAARSLGLQLHVLHASSERDIEKIFTSFRGLQARALSIGPDPFFNTRIQQLAALAVRHGVPAIYQYREFAEAGGLIAYGGSLTDAYRQAGAYATRILKGEKPADLPVQQSTRLELMINLKTAKALGLTIPATLLARADEVIE